MNPADLDDRVDRHVDELLRVYEQERQPRDEISLTQLAALSAAAEAGWEPLLGVVNKRCATGDRNERAVANDKGTTQAKNPAFWRAMKSVLEGSMKHVGEDVEHRNLVASLFASRLAIEVRYRRETLGGTR